MRIGIRKTMISSRIFGSFLLIVFHCVKWSEGNTAAQCAQFGINDEHNWIYGNNGQHLKNGYYTIAAYEFDAMWTGSLGSRYGICGDINHSLKIRKNSDGSCPWVFPPCNDPQGGAADSRHIEPCVDNSLVRMDMYLVKQEGRVLHGWLHVEIELLDQTDEIEIVYIQMRDEAFNAIGEFVTADSYPGATCKPTKDNLATPKYYEFFPCSATGLREAKTSGAIMMAKKEYYFNKDVVQNKLVHEGSIERGVHFLWKFEEYWCSRHLKIQPYAYILTRKNREVYKDDSSLNTKMYRKVPNFWLHPDWFGPADIIFPHGTLDCSEKAINDDKDSGQVSPTAVESWLLDQSSKTTLDGDNWHPKNRYQIYLGKDDNGNDIYGNYGSNLCQADPLDKKQKKNTVPVFSGRCAGHFEKTVSTKFFQGCNLNVNAPEFDAIRNKFDQFTPYKAYNDKKVLDRLALCNDSNPCHSPDSQTDLDAIKVKDRGNTTGGKEIQIIKAGVNDVRSKARIQKFWHGRKYHGILCSVVAFFITPLYIFIARYYKETFMSKRCYDIPIWYWIHVCGIIVAAILFASGHASISPNFPVWGRSLHSYGRGHMVVGYASAFIFGLLIVFGGFRCGTDAKGSGKYCRLFTITMHSLLGFLHYFLNLIAIILSGWIPQSPTLQVCDKKTGMPTGIGPVVLVGIAFIFIDLTLHIILTVTQCITDRSLQISKRGWWCPIIPILPLSSVSDYARGFLRKMVLILYLILTSLLTFVVIYLIGSKELPDNCRTGPMSCKHIFGCTKLAIQYETWFKNQGGEIDAL